MLHILVGNTGAGKTTYANMLKQHMPAVVFSIDEWNQTLFMMDKTPDSNVDWFLERIERAETMIQSLILQMQDKQIDLILDLGFAKFAHREKFRAFAKQNSINYQLHYLNFDKQIRHARVIHRNQEKGDTFQFEVSEQDFEFMENWFEPPTQQELEGAIIIDV